MSKRQTLGITLALVIIGILLSILFTALNRIRPIHRSVNEPGSPSPQRIICSAPSLVETVYALGEEKRIVGISDFTTYPPAALEKEKIGGLMNPNFEKILALKPDLILIQGVMARYQDFCREKKIPLLRVDMENLESIYAGIRSIGAVLGCPVKAGQLIEDIQNRLDQAYQKAGNRGGHPSIFVCLSRKSGSFSGLYTINRESFLNEILAAIGFRNVFGDVPGHYPHVSKETLLKRDADFILELHAGEDLPPGTWKTLKEEWQIMPTLSAVSSGRIYMVTDAYVLIPGPRIPWIAERFVHLLGGDDEPAS